jgi:hypothetical protein
MRLDLPQFPTGYRPPGGLQLSVRMPRPAGISGQPVVRSQPGREKGSAFVAETDTGPEESGQVKPDMMDGN